MSKPMWNPIKSYDELSVITNNTLMVSYLVANNAISSQAASVYHHVQYVSFLNGDLSSHHPITTSRLGNAIGIVTDTITAKYIKEAIEVGLITSIKDKGKATRYAINQNIEA